MFASRADLLTCANARRLAQLAVPADYAMPVSDTALRAVIEGAELAGFPAEEQTALTLALFAIDRALSDADELLLSYGVPAEIQTTLLARLASTVALYYLQGAERMTADVEKAYKAVIDLLKAFARGEVDFAAPDPNAPPEGGLAMIDSAPARYGCRAPFGGRNWP
jgi:phage gp36-like protein